jgi:hypothetical protein
MLTKNEYEVFLEISERLGALRSVVWDRRTRLSAKLSSIPELTDSPEVMAEGLAIGEAYSETLRPTDLLDRAYKPIMELCNLARKDR